MASNKEIKSVSFNKTVAKDVDMLRYMARKNFSGYVKKLIELDMNKRTAETQSLPELIAEVTAGQVAATTPETPQQRIERIRKQAAAQAAPKPFIPTR